MNIKTTDEQFPMNLLDAIAGGQWEHKLPEDFYPSLAYVLATLTEREQTVILKRFKERQTLEEIGKIFRVQRERVRQIEAKAIRKLSHPERRDWLIYGVRGKIRRAAEAAYEGRLEVAVNALTIIADGIRAVGGAEALAKFAEVEEGRRSGSPDIEIDHLGLSIRACNGLKRVGVKTLRDITKFSIEELQNVRCLGNKSCNEVIAKLGEYGLSLRRGRT